ncbi:MAG: VOC family protein [Actinobacteria bacterium]|nr:MAG: VOC family protein [Actinomycetota bacterium]
MLDHVTANVGDLERAKGFYSQALAPLGYSLQMEFEGGAGFGAGEGMADFWLGSSSERGATHVAFSAPNRAAVDAFHEAAMAAGGKDNGAPGLRPHYHEHFYAAYVHDPDGNNIEPSFLVAENPQGFSVRLPMSSAARARDSKAKRKEKP